MTEKFYLKADWEEKKKEVTKEQFMMAEQAAGFHSKFGPGNLATGGFSGNGITGSIRHDEEINLCDDCVFQVPECPAIDEEVEYGNGFGRDNIVKCECYQKAGG